MDPTKLNSNPWDNQPLGEYIKDGTALVDTTCVQMAKHVARVVGWYTAGGFHDDCGHFHESGLKYDWWGLSILNENEHDIKPDDGRAYMTCYNAINAKVKKKTVLVGPEIDGDGRIPSLQYNFLTYFLDP